MPDFVPDAAPDFVPDRPPPGPGFPQSLKITSDDVKLQLHNLFHLGGQVAQVPANAAMGMANLVADPITAAADKVTAAAGHPLNMQLPSKAWEQAKNQVYGGALAPNSAGDRLIQAIGPLVATAGASGPGASQSLLNPLPSTFTPSSYTNAFGANAKVPANFVSPAQSQAQMTADLLQRGSAAGFKTPPATTNPNFKNTAIETYAGNEATQQGASVKNAPAVNKLAATELGLDPSLPLTTASIRQVRQNAVAGYQAVRKVGPITTDEQYWQPLMDMEDKYTAVQQAFPGTPKSPILDDINSLAQSKFPSSPAVDKIIALRDKATSAFKAGDNSMGADYKTLAKNLEDQIDRSVSTNPNVSPDVVANFRNSRQMMAKSHDVEAAFNPATNNVSAKTLANNDDGQLTGGLKLAADYARKFPKAMQDPEKIGSAGISKLESMAPLIGSLMGAGHGAEGGAFGAALGAAVPIGSRLSKAYALGPGQSGIFPSTKMPTLYGSALAQALLGSQK
jgi:hypothetical protein